MNWKKWISIAAAVCLAVTAVPMRAVAQEELLQEKMLEEIKEEIKEELKEEKEEPKEEKEELKEEKEELKEEKEEKEKLQEQSDEKTEPQEESKKELPKGISLLMEEEYSTKCGRTLLPSNWQKTVITTKGEKNGKKSSRKNQASNRSRKSKSVTTGWSCIRSTWC